MRLQLRSAFFLLQACCALALAARPSNDEQQQPQQPEELGLTIKGAPIMSSQARAARIAEFVTSHKIPDDVRRKDARLFDEEEEDEEEDDRPGQARVDLEDFGRSGLLYDDDARRGAGQHVRQYADKQDENLAGVRVSLENPTTMLPILTTQRDTRPFDFVPVNILREDAKGNPFVPFDNKNFEDLGDVSLVPAGSNTRIQVKKGPNGKDYEYEYVYYYYDEEDEGKAGGATASNSQEVPSRTAAPSSATGSRRGSPARGKYNTVDRTTSTTTVEPVINEVIPSGNGNRARHLEAAQEEVSEERLPTNTRFPPRSRGSHVAETTERASRVRGNRQRTAPDPVDSSSFRSHQEGPEFPQSLPNGPVRFLGVTPNEGIEEKAPAPRGRGRPQRIQEPAPVQETTYDEPPAFTRKRPASLQYDNAETQPERGQFRQQNHQAKDDEYGLASSSPRNLQEDAYTELAGDVTDAPTTQVPHAMDKVALDLYAFLQQGRSNLVDFVKEADDAAEATDSSSDAATTDPSGSAEGTTFSATEPEDAASTTSVPTTIPSTTTSTTTTTTTTTTTPTPTTSEEPSTPGFGRPKFRRPAGPATSRNRFKSSGSSASNGASTEVAPTETSAPTQRARGRFGSGAAPGGSFKRSRPKQQQQQPAEEPAAQRESAEKVSAEAKPAPGAGRNRFRSTSSRASQPARTTPAPAANRTTTPGTTASAGPTGIHRPGAFGKLAGGARRRGGRPGSPAVSTPAPAASEDAAGEQTASSASPAQEVASSEEKRPIAKLPGGGNRPKPLHKPIIKPGAGRLNLRPRPGQATSTSTTEATAADAAPAAEATPEEPASEGTEEETREAPAESSPTARPTPASPLNKLRNRNRLQVQPRTTTARTAVPPAARRSHLLPRRKTTEAPAPEPEAPTETDAADAADAAISEEAEATEAQAASVAAESTTTARHEEARGLGGLLAPRRRIAPRRPGQIAA